MTPQRHLISDISFAAGWVTCTCGKKLHVSTKGREVDGGTDEEPWEPYATVTPDRSGAVIVWLLGAIVAALVVGWLVVR
jgi:hypothetical protein